MTKFFQDYFEHYLSEDEMIEINDLWECVCDGDYPDDIFEEYVIAFLNSSLVERIIYKSILLSLRKVLTVEVANLMKSIADNRHHHEENPNYHITKDQIITVNNTANSMGSSDELSKITSDKFNNDIDKYDIQLGKHAIAKKIIDNLCPMLDGEEYEEEH